MDSLSMGSRTLPFLNQRHFCLLLGRFSAPGDPYSHELWARWNGLLSIWKNRSCCTLWHLFHLCCTGEPWLFVLLQEPWGVNPPCQLSLHISVLTRCFVAFVHGVDITSILPAITSSRPVSSCPSSLAGDHLSSSFLLFLPSKNLLGPNAGGLLSCSTCCWLLPRFSLTQFYAKLHLFLMLSPVLSFKVRTARPQPASLSLSCSLSFSTSVHANTPVRFCWISLEIFF